jgi:hypothetical protein
LDNLVLDGGGIWEVLERCVKRVEGGVGGQTQVGTIVETSGQVGGLVAVALPVVACGWSVIVIDLDRWTKRNTFAGEEARLVNSLARVENAVSPVSTVSDEDTTGDLLLRDALVGLDNGRSADKGDDHGSVVHLDVDWVKIWIKMKVGGNEWSTRRSWKSVEDERKEGWRSRDDGAKSFGRQDRDCSNGRQ